MININNQLRKYFISIAIISVLFITIVSNISMNYFFTNYVKASRLQDDQKLVQYIERLYEDGGGILDERSLMNILHYSYSEAIDIKLKTNDNQVVWESGTSDIMMHGMMGGMIDRKAYSKTNVVYKDYPMNYKEQQLGIISVGRPQSILVTTQDRGFVYTINGVYIAAFIFSMILAGILSMHVSKKFLKPIYSIKENAKLIENERYSQLHDVNTGTFELHDLSISIKELAEKLEYQDVLRKRLTTDIAHELRTPLATLQSHIEAFMDGVWEPTQEKLLGIHDEITRLTKLIKNLSDLSRIESEEIKLDLQPVNLSSILNNVVDNFEPLLISKDIKIKKYIQCDIEIMGDADRLNQIFINLLSNAYKYTNEEGQIIVRLTELKDKFSILIEDTGVGISKEDLSHIFERFYRGDVSRSRETGGTGIGLTITKALIEAHKGSVKIESEVSKGTKVMISFPKPS
ncbi:HAMP domain-containing sensor histidine kinase [Petroclostridium sp. X23]|uniref:sensor histidine kinase n=1 Tax=Petroclostridium sp. X23 TaxID=3045146 RepID=UPI0024AC9532|nr:HAMP domain-containing sensor histidine kinase [Petroclostridium sp. X23]WHH59977.1 HAMP domain-containing sensor histidine kinase [Petroclostridium sp. X23]